MTQLWRLFGKIVGYMFGGAWGGAAEGYLISYTLPVTDANQDILLGLLIGAVLLPLVMLIVYLLPTSGADPSKKPTQAGFSISLAKWRLGGVDTGEIVTYMLFLFPAMAFLGFLWVGRMGWLLGYLLFKGMSIDQILTYANRGAQIGAIALPLVGTIFIVAFQRKRRLQA